MAFVANRMSQLALGAAAVAQVTGQALKTTYISEIWINNSGSSARTVTLYTMGTAAVNILATIPIAANSSVIIQQLKIVLNAGEILYAKQDAGTDVSMTTYGGAE